MIYELRAYDLLPGKGPQYLDHFRQDGVQYVTRHLPMAGYWLTDSGSLNRLYHLWIYTSLDERLACRAGLAGDADWNDGFVPKGFPLIVAQRNMLMELNEDSAALAAVRDARKQVHPGQAASSAMFEPGYLSLTFGEGRVAGAECLGRWRVVSGEAPGTSVTLCRHAMDAPLAAVGEVQRHELLRALSCSPLR
ncbi:NIPSNAP family protein [Seohaeicola zhoushanensis]|uniref:NIPSNAP domain-containing protein n=1 Tax=Seohaeicola zhoushanensis TaxID=1569283 RepID=A0A8J3GXE6_9RHOB|nr:NIPSNAP family protein [Seohaeicola zhoushanensis]GHF48431.1 hypothetical protein GCM10017056_19970 [Seohaeicola zhoushanensis]